MIPFDLLLFERLKDEVGGLARKKGVLEGWSRFLRSGGRIPIFAEPFLFESIRNVREISYLKLHHVACETEQEAASFRRLLSPAKSVRDSFGDHARSLASEAEERARALSKYRNDFVAHPKIEPPDEPSLALDRAFSKVFECMEACQQAVVANIGRPEDTGAMNFDDEIQRWRKSTQEALEAIWSNFEAVQPI